MSSTINTEKRNIMTHRSKSVTSLIAILLLALSLTAAFTQDEAAEGPHSSSFAGVSAVEKVVIFTDEAIVEVNNPANMGFSSLVWNQDGSLLAYILFDQDYTAHIMVADTSGREPIMLNTGPLEAGFPITFTPDGKILYAGQGDFTGEQPYQVSLMQIIPEANAQPEIVGSIRHGVGCGGGSPLPADWAYNREAGFGGSAVRLQWTDYGILHSTTCGGTGLALFDPQTGEDRPLTPDAIANMQGSMPEANYGRSALSADGRTLVAVKMEFGDEMSFSVVTIDLQSGEITDARTSQMPDQVAWGPDGSVFYSTREQIRNLTDDMSEEGRAQFTQLFGDVFEIPAYLSSIYQVNLATGEETALYSGYHYAVGRMAMNADNSALLFTIVQNMDGWIAGIADGSLSFETDPDGSRQLATVAAALLEKRFDTNEDAAFISYVGQVAPRPNAE
jgi:hypothetical protein